MATRTHPIGVAPHLGRTAEQIGRTTAGPRPLPPLAGATRRRPPTQRETVLDDGLRVIAVRKAGTPLVEARLRIPFAGRSEVHTARAELLASTVLLGTARRTREQVDAELATVGGHLDATVDPRRLLLSGSVLAPGLDVLLDVLGDTLRAAAYRGHDVAGERERLVEHLAVAAAQPSVMARRYLQMHRFGDHPAAREMPDAEAVAEVGPAAVRGLHHRAVVPAGSTLILVGELSPARALDAVAAALAGWASAGHATQLAGTPEVAPGPVLAVHRDGAVQSQVRLSSAAVGRADPDYAACQLANLVYGGYFSSRLVENIREAKGYTYSAHSSLEFWPGSAAVTIAFDTATPSTAAALLEARYELGRLVVAPPSVSEIDAARNYAQGTLATSLATQAGYAAQLAALIGSGLDAEWLAAHPARLAGITVEDVARVAARVFAPAAFTGVVVGDMTEVADDLQALGGVEFE